jgi:hypothetical protein
MNEANPPRLLRPDFHVICSRMRTCPIQLQAYFWFWAWRPPFYCATLDYHRRGLAHFYLVHASCPALPLHFGCDFVKGSYRKRLTARDGADRS